jgi:thioredoxin 1
MAANLTDANFKEEVLESNIPVLIDFWAEWCGPCRVLIPVIEELSKVYAGKVKILKMNIDENPNTPSSLGVRSIPTMMLFNNGKQIATKIGVLPQSTIEQWINSLI